MTSTLERGVCGARNQKDRGGRVCGDQNKSERGPGLWRSQSEADLSSQSTETQQKHQQNPTEPHSQNPNEFHTPSQDENHNQCHSQDHEQNVERNHKLNPDKNLKQRVEESYVDASVSPLEDPGSETYTEPLCPSPEMEREREETESSDDNVTLYSIHPPQDCPYLLLLQGYCNRQVGHTVLHSLTPRVPRTTLSLINLPLEHLSPLSLSPFSPLLSPSPFSPSLSF